MMKSALNPDLKVVVVDLDNTLIKGSINLMLAKKEARGLTALRMVGKLGKLTLASRGNPDIAKQMIDVGSVLFVGKREDEMEQRLQSAWKAMRPNLFVDMKERLAEHQSAGAKVWLAGPAPQQVVEIMARELKAERGFGVRMKKDAQGRLTDEVEEPLVYREGKRDAVLAALKDEGVDPADVRFYSDSPSDIPLLEAVGDPVCTNPSKELRTLANERGWPIDEYSRTIG